MITKNPGTRSLMVCPSGDIDALVAEEMRRQIRPPLNEGFVHIIFDLEQTRYVTSSGLGLLVEIYNWLTRTGGSLRLVNCSERIEAVLRETRLDQMLHDPEDPLPLNVSFDQLHTLLSREALFSSRLHELTESLLAARNPEQTAALVLEGMADACDSRRGGIFLYLPQTHELSLVGAMGLDSPTFAAACTVSLAGDGLERMLIQAGEESSVWCTRLGKPVEAPSRLQQILGFDRSILCCLKAGGRLQAFVMLHEPEGAARSADFWVPQLRFYCDISAQFLQQAHRLNHLENENSELRDQLSQAQRAHETLSDVGKIAALGTVISGVGHLLNNKLVPIVGYTQLLSQHEDIPERAQRQIETVSTAAGELKSTMDDLIRVSRARQISPQPCDINQILASVVTMYAPTMEASGVKIRLQFESHLPLVSGDPDLLIQAFYVLLKRASQSFDQGAEDSWIELRTRVADQTVEVVVEDNGPGVATGASEDLIDPLAPYLHSEDGDACNFSIPRSVIRRHSGELSLESRPGGGTRVRLSIPAASDAINLAPLGVSSEA